MEVGKGQDITTDSGRDEADVEGEHLMAAVAKRLGLESDGVQKIGRFTVLERVGRGGMGVVYAVYDEELDRRVALKLIRGGAAPELRTRLQREARALAKLSHPNVVPVFEVGEHHDEAFIVMEFVKGETLGHWVAKEDRSADEILDKFIQAGRGLAAAHGAQLVHRDFKPDNAVVGEGGRVRVLDFGLAGKRDDAQATTQTVTTQNTSTRDAFDTPLTATGAMMGTPMYMAPEQFLGEKADHRCDQFAFCVALWEALCGLRPFPGDTRHELSENVIEGNLRSPPRDAKLPGSVRALIERGLRRQPADRWPSMDALLGALARARGRSRRQLLGAVALTGLLGSAGAGLVWFSSRTPPCSGAAEHLAETWNATRREHVETAMLGTQLPYATSAWERTSDRLDQYANAWTTMHTDACMATRVRGEQSTEVMDLRMACLHRARVELGSVVDVLADADEDVMGKAHELVDGLADINRCADVDALRADVEPPPDKDAAQVAKARALLAAARASREATRYADAKVKLEEARTVLATVDYEPAHIELSLAEGVVLRSLGQYDKAEVALGRALAVATRRLQRREMSKAAVTLLGLVGYTQRRSDEAINRFDMLAEELAQGEGPAEASYLTAHALVLSNQWKYAEAEAEMRRALALVEQERPPRNVAIAETRRTIANTLERQQKLPEAEEEIRRALELYASELGDEHPLVARTHIDLGTILQNRGKLDEAENAYRTSLELQLRLFGTDHPTVAASHTGLAIVLDMQGKTQGAEDEFRAALDSTVKALGREHPDVAAAYDNLAVFLLKQRKYAESEAENRRALELWGKTLGPDHPDVAFSRSNLGLALSRQGKHAEAAAEHRYALTVFQKELGADHPDVAMERVNLAHVLLRMGETAEALSLAELGWARRKQDDIPEFDRAEAARVLADALWQSNVDADGLARARALAERALPTYEKAGEIHAETTQWLRERLRKAPR